MSREKDVSTEQARSQAPPWIPCAHGDQGWPQGHCRSPRPWPQAPFGVTRQEGCPVRHTRAGTVGRLTKRPDFVAAASGRRFHTERMTVQGRLRQDLGLGRRVGVRGGKKVGQATERNRIKRRLRTAVQLAAAEYLDAPTGVVVIARRD